MPGLVFGSCHTLHSCPLGGCPGYPSENRRMPGSLIIQLSAVCDPAGDTCCVIPLTCLLAAATSTTMAYWVVVLDAYGRMTDWFMDHMSTICAPADTGCVMPLTCLLAAATLTTRGTGRRWWLPASVWPSCRLCPDCSVARKPIFRTALCYCHLTALLMCLLLQQHRQQGPHGEGGCHERTRGRARARGRAAA